MTMSHHTLPIGTLPATDALLRCATAHGSTLANLFRSAWACCERRSRPAAKSPFRISCRVVQWARRSRQSAVMATLFHTPPCRVAFGKIAVADLGRFVRDMHADYTRGMEHHDISVLEVVSRAGEELTTLESSERQTTVDIDIDDNVGRVFTTLVNYRGGALPACRRLERVEEVACFDPKDY